MVTSKEVKIFLFFFKQFSGRLNFHLKRWAVELNIQSVAEDWII